VLRRRLIGGVNEKQVVQLFASVRLSQEEDGEPGDLDIVNNIGVDEDLDDLDFEYLSIKRYSYSREHKLAAIDYFQTTWRENKDGTHKRLSN
jgi:RecJ-like exonuclease